MKGTMPYLSPIRLKGGLAEVEKNGCKQTFTCLAERGQRWDVITAHPDGGRRQAKPTPPLSALGLLKFIKTNNQPTIQ